MRFYACGYDKTQLSCIYLFGYFLDFIGSTLDLSYTTWPPRHVVKRLHLDKREEKTKTTRNHPAPCAMNPNTHALLETPVRMLEEAGSVCRRSLYIDKTKLTESYKRERETREIQVFRTSSAARNGRREEDDVGAGAAQPSPQLPEGRLSLSPGLQPAGG